MDCNIRDIDADLMREMKIDALKNGIPLREWCITVFVEALPAYDPFAKTLPEPLVRALRKDLEATSKPRIDPLAHDPTCKCLMCKPPKPA